MTGRIRELLQVLIGPPQLLFFLLLFMNLSIRSDPHPDFAISIAHGVSTAEMPSVFSIGTPKPVLEMEWLSALNRLAPTTDVFLEIVGMNKLRPAPILDLVER